jgi:ribosomal protein S6--L-glutamate ligase
VNGPLVALGSRLRSFSEFITLGVKPDFNDYSQSEQALIHSAPRIFYPSLAYAALFSAMGKEIYPSLASHFLAGDKIKQSRMFQMLGLPHPKTRIYYGKQRRAIQSDFQMPFIAKVPRASALGKGVYLISDQTQLHQYLLANDPAYIQEYLPMERDLRVVVIGKKPVCAYWRQARPDEYRHNLAQGGKLDFFDIPQTAVDLAVKSARLCGVNEVGVDLAWHNGQGYLLEFNMKFGHQGPKKAGVDITSYIARAILAGEL